jgi:hypothetical protein
MLSTYKASQLDEKNRDATDGKKVAVTIDAVINAAFTRQSNT